MLQIKIKIIIIRFFKALLPIDYPGKEERIESGNIDVVIANNNLH
jgi:hypothetical protein